MPSLFTPTDIANYYDHTEVHYRRFWKLDQGMGLHYGIWDKKTGGLAAAILHTNERLARLGGIAAGEQILDAGCGVGGSAIFLARQYGCTVTGITLSRRQVERATAYATGQGVSKRTHFLQRDYTNTEFSEGSYDAIWAIESMQTAADKRAFFREMKRVMQPQGRLLIADIFKHGTWHIAQTPRMQTMLNGWAMSDILSLEELAQCAAEEGMHIAQHEDVTAYIAPSVKKIYIASLVGMVGTWAYNVFQNATHFSKIHYKTGLAQHQTYCQGLWGYHLLELKNRNL